MSNALGQNEEDTIYFKVLSNTSDFNDNNTSHFRVNPYGSIQFDHRFFLG